MSAGVQGNGLVPHSSISVEVIDLNCASGLISKLIPHFMVFPIWRVSIGQGDTHPEDLPLRWHWLRLQRKEDTCSSHKGSAKSGISREA